MTEEPGSFQEFISIYFEQIGHDWEDLYLVDRPSFTDRQIVSYLTQLFSNAGELLGPYSDQQVSLGLNALFHDSVYFALHRDGRSNWPERRRALRSIYSLFEQVFDHRCSPHLSHLDESGANPLNGVCYMWWENYPVKTTRRPDLGGDETRLLESNLLLGVMERILYLNSDACKESALHGLNHWGLYRPRKTRRIIDQFLERCGRDLRAELWYYALGARERLWP